MRSARRLGSPSRRASTPETVLITGGAGFIGSHLADTLLARGQRVRALDSLRRRSGRRVGKDFTFNRPPIDQEKRRRADRVARPVGPSRAGCSVAFRPEGDTGASGTAWGRRFDKEEPLLVLERKSRLHLRAARLSRFDDNGADGHAAHHDVPHREGVLRRRCVGPELGDQRPASIDDTRSEVAVLARVDTLDPGTHYSDGAPTDIERGRVRGRVDAERESR
jgi:NAD(P)-dependent dehydrogenase (short-subunit alcohol dehydrogenase family)